MGLLLNNFVKNSICFYSTPQEILHFSERSEGANSRKRFIILSLAKRVDPCGLSGVRTWLAPTLFPGFLLPVPIELERESERPWLGLVTWLQNNIYSEGGVRCLTIFCLVHAMITRVRKSKMDLLDLQL